MAGLTPLLGRDVERAELHALLQGPSRLVSVVGLAGVGKSRLVEEVLGELRDKRPIWRVSLAGQEQRPADRVLHALFCEPGGPADRVGRVLDALGPALLVLDAVEGCVEPLAEQLVEWLQQAPALRVLLTSRRALGLAGESRLVLEPLSGANGLLLLLDGAQRIRRDLRLPEAAARELVLELDGLPQALEWAAAQLAVLSVEDLLAVLQRGEVGRPSFLRGIAWSLLRLSEPQREGLSRLWAYRQPLPAREAARVVGGLEVLQELRQASLLGPVGAEARLRVYRAVALVLEGDEWRASRERAWQEHASAVLARAHELQDALVGSGGPQALSELVELEPELVTVVQRARVLGVEVAAQAIEPLGALRVYGRGEPLPEAWLGALLGEATLRPGSRAKLLCARAGGRVEQGRIEEALQDLDEAEALAQGTPELAWVLLVRGPAQRRAGDRRGSRVTAERLLVWARSEAEPAVEMEALSMLAHLASTREESEQLARAAVSLGRSSGNLLGMLGPLLLLAESPEEFRQGAQIASDAGFARAAYYFHNALASRLLETGQTAAAARHADEAQTLARRNGWDRLVRESRALYDLVRWSFDPAVDCRASVRWALTDSRGEADAGVLLSFLYAAEAEASPREPLPSFPAAGRIAALCEAAAQLHRAAGGPAEQAQQALERAQHLLDDTVYRPFISERAAMRVVLRAKARLEGQPALSLRVGEGGAWFSLGDGPRISLARRVPLQRLLWALARADAPLSVEALFGAGWPGQSIRPASAAHRVHVAVGELRKLGLGERLLTGEGGYRLSGQVTEP
jgi:hypothetical protein